MPRDLRNQLIALSIDERLSERFKMEIRRELGDLPGAGLSITTDEAQRIVRAYDRVKYYPEGKPDGWAHMLELRQAVEAIVRRVPPRR